MADLTRMLFWGQGCCIEDKATVLRQAAVLGTRLLYLGQAAV